MGRHALIAAAAISLLARSALADGSALRPSVGFRDCATDSIGEASFLQALALELDVRSLRGNDRSQDPRIDVHFYCDASALIRIGRNADAIERRVRFDDVSRPQRARAVALVVAELFRTQGAALAAAEASAPAESAMPRAEGDPTRDAGPAELGGARPLFRIGVAARAAVAGPGSLFGGNVGANLGFLYLQGDLLLARRTVPSGTIVSGVAALRAGRTFALVRPRPFELRGGASLAAGGTWAVGDSRAAGTIAEEVVLPYVDFRLEVVGCLRASPAFAPDVVLYAGRAAGILARADSQETQATGGWFAGAEVGLRF